MLGKFLMFVKCGVYKKGFSSVILAVNGLGTYFTYK